MKEITMPEDTPSSLNELRGLMIYNHLTGDSTDEECMDILVELTTRLHALLISRDFNSKYEAMPDSLFQVLHIYLMDNDGAFIIIYMDLLDLRLGHEVVKCIEDLVTKIEETISRYRAWVSDIIRLRSGREYCMPCHYCDPSGLYCGRGLELHEGCTHRNLGGEKRC